MTHNKHYTMDKNELALIHTVIGARVSQLNDLMEACDSVSDSTKQYHRELVKLLNKVDRMYDYAPLHLAA